MSHADSRTENSSVKRAARPVHILIVDDHPLVREGLAARISAQSDLKVCGQAADIDEALTIMLAVQPELVIVDLALKRGSGLELIKKMQSAGMASKVLVVSAYDETLFAERALRAGAQGYINKQELQGSVIDAIRAVMRGELYVSTQIMHRFTGRAAAGTPPLHGVDVLSDREMQVFELIGRGLSTRTIAGQLRRSVHTIESHRENIRRKLQLRDGSELLQHAMHWVFENRP